MKIIANDYEPKDIFRIVREWTGLTQEQLSESQGKKGRSWVKEIEKGNNRFFFQDLLKIAKENNFIITIEKK